ncbi:hypothetical protein [Calothrix sp. PCC 7507]|uniref:hypothetical protein n=1 Tax=Calothrix sp. PCC 7507 TaxID=99598 RepID=UPI00029F33B9|nr:hypothetical protein [Calothrix sp. PCC 7507]AFY35516.1 hypothetical protein Cal7507_5175 [Calothrix sp. PCC 7507]
MNTQRHEIMKLPTEASSATESTPLRSYVVRNIEILKSIIISIEITQEAIAPMIAGLIVVTILFL